MERRAPMSIAVGLELYNNMSGFGGYSAYNPVRAAKAAQTVPAFSASDAARTPASQPSDGAYLSELLFKHSHDTLEIGGVIVNGKPDAQSAPDGKTEPSSINTEGADSTAQPDDGHCETCENRKYQDESGDSSVSFQNPTKISPDAASSLVRSHEAEHVSHNQIKAAKEGREVVSQSVAIHTAICPDCGRIYVSGGTTRTVTKNAPQTDERFSAGKKDVNTPKLMDVVA